MRLLSTSGSGPRIALGCDFFEGVVMKRADSPYPVQLRSATEALAVGASTASSRKRRRRPKVQR